MEFLYRLQLEGEQIEIKSAHSAQAALDILEGFEPDVIMLDLMLPKSNGLSFLYELRSYEDWRNIPVLIISSLPMHITRINKETLKQLGVGDYLDKSEVKRSEIIEALGAVASGKKL